MCMSNACFFIIEGTGWTLPSISQKMAKSPPAKLPTEPNFYKFPSPLSPSSLPLLLTEMGYESLKKSQ